MKKAELDIILAEVLETSKRVTGEDNKILLRQLHAMLTGFGIATVERDK